MIVKNPFKWGWHSSVSRSHEWARERWGVWLRSRLVGGDPWPDSSTVRILHRVTECLHVLQHAAPNAAKPVHGVFTGAREDVLPYVDGAWTKSGQQ